MKLITLIGLAIAVWSLVRRFLPAASGGPAPRAQVEDLRRCPRCGGWGPEGVACDCRTPPVP